MKTKILTCTIIFCAFLSLNAQDINKSNTSNTGLKFGYNLASVSFDGNTETGKRHGFHIGIYGESFLTKATALQIELLYSQQGYKLKDNSGTFTQKLDYINVPLLFKVYPNKNFFLETGPQVGLSISHKEEFDSSFDLFNSSKVYDPDNFDWGVNFGGGFTTNSGISFGVRYLLGLGSVYNQGSPKNRLWQFSLGFDF